LLHGCSEGRNCGGIVGRCERATAPNKGQRGLGTPGRVLVATGGLDELLRGERGGINAVSIDLGGSLQENGYKTYKRLTMKCPNQQKVLGTMDFCQFIVVQNFLSIFLSNFVNVFVNFVNLSIYQFFFQFL
jgi:hypothetical protein